MPAANISEIRAHQAAVQGAVTKRLAAAGVPGFHDRSEEDLPDCHVWPMFSRGRATGHVKKLPAAVGGWEYDLFADSILTIEIFSPRLSPEPKTLLAVYDYLEELAVRCDHALSGFAGRDAINAELPWHHLDALRPQAEQRGFDEERNIDRHTLSYVGNMGIKAAAWPTTAAAYELQ
jgi:hypothetical protein